MTTYVEIDTGLREATFPTRYEAEFFVKRVRADYPARGYNTSCKIVKLEDNLWEVSVDRWNSCS